MEDDALFYVASKDATPMMSQYLSTKEKYPGCLLMFRMGDFFEMFFEDAKVASSLLSIALTQRGKHAGQDIPMCGVPVASLDSYIAKLVRYGHKVAICDQTEDPQEAKKRGAKAIVNREVIRVITPGTIVEDTLLNAHQHNFLMSIVPQTTKSKQISMISFAVIDISTGDFFVNTTAKNEFFSLIDIYAPKEILMPSVLENGIFNKEITQGRELNITFLPDAKFNPLVEKGRLEKYFKVTTLDSFEIQTKEELACCGSILEYLLITQKENVSTLPPPKKKNFSDYLIIDAATAKSLEIISSSHGGYKGSLLEAIDDTKTPFGARSLASRLSMPIINIEKINSRLNCVQFFIENESTRKIIRENLAQCPDFDRSINRVKFNKFSPRDIGNVRDGLRVLDVVSGILKDKGLPTEDDSSLEDLKDFSDLLHLLNRSLIEKLPSTAKDGKIIQDGYNPKLDKLKYLKENSNELILNLQAKYISETGVATLKIKNNAILGWYIEVPKMQSSKLGKEFMHRQSLVGAVRYTTFELLELQKQVVEAYEDWFILEQELYHAIITKVSSYYNDILAAVKFLSNIDIQTSFAEIAVARSYTRPMITDEPIIEIEDGRHPILALNIPDFSDNSCVLTERERIRLLTGPNMAGKSTYLRQNALLVILAQIGCFVPARKARIGIVDRLFSRIGASDDIARGRSTFMVEMIETATILNQATPKSFVILDEVGRGTSTYDGLAIAWAVIEHLYKTNKCRVLFATHYRELTKLKEEIPEIRCSTLKVQEWNGEVIFYHQIIDGIADKSYGIHVASLAGVPKSVIKVAKKLLNQFEKDDKGATTFQCQAELDYTRGNETVNDEIKDYLKSINLDELTPRAAWDVLHRLQTEFCD